MQILYTDGMVITNPGEGFACYTVTHANDDNSILYYCPLDGPVTANQAEFAAFCMGAQHVLDLSIPIDEIRIDSQVLEHCLQHDNEPKVKWLKPLYTKARRLYGRIHRPRLVRVRSRQNLADMLKAGKGLPRQEVANTLPLLPFTRGKK